MRLEEHLWDSPLDSNLASRSHMCLTPVRKWRVSIAACVSSKRSLRKRYKVEEQNSIKQAKKFQTEFKAMEATMREMRVDINDLKSKFRILISELKLYATKEEMKVLEKYVNMWDPVTFVTRGEAENMVRRIVEDEYNQVSSKEQPKRNMHIR